jgi:hypothetical protein
MVFEQTILVHVSDENDNSSINLSPSKMQSVTSIRHLKEEYKHSSQVCLPNEYFMHSLPSGCQNYWFMRNIWVAKLTYFLEDIMLATANIMKDLNLIHETLKLIKKRSWFSLSYTIQSSGAGLLGHASKDHKPLRIIYQVILKISNTNNLGFQKTLFLW